MKFRAIAMLILAAGAAACAGRVASDADIIRAALRSFDRPTFRELELDERPPCNYGVAPEDCPAHSAAVVQAARSVLTGPNTRRGRVQLSAVRDSADAKVVDVYIVIDSIDVGLGGATLSRVIVSRDARRVISSKLIMGETIASPVSRDTFATPGGVRESLPR